MASATRTPAAEQDLDAILARLNTSSPEKAEAFAALVNARCAVVAAQPKMGRLREEFAPGLRSFVIDRCVFYYQITDGGISIIRIIHGSQDADAIMRDE